MTDLLTMPELWLGAGMLGAGGYFFLFEGKRQKQRKARLARVVTPQFRRKVEQTHSLRRKDPTEGSALAQRLAGISSIEKLRGRLEMAGMAATPQKLLKIIAGVFVGTLLVLVGLLGKPLVMGLPVAVVVSVGGANALIKRKIRKRQLLFLKLFPEAIELIVRGLRAGLPVAESFNTVAKEIPAPVGDMFALIGQQTQLGVPLEKALIEAAAKINITEFNFFVTTIIMQRETGGNLGEILSNLADMLRQRQMMKLKIFALSSEARASAYIIGSLPFVVFLMLSVVSPHYLAPFYNDYRGNMAILAALGTMGLGGLVMRRMTQLEI